MVFCIFHRVGYKFVPTCRRNLLPHTHSVWIWLWRDTMRHHIYFTRQKVRVLRV